MKIQDKKKEESLNKLLLRKLQILEFKDLNYSKYLEQPIITPDKVKYETQYYEYLNDENIIDFAIDYFKIDYDNAELEEKIKFLERLTKFNKETDKKIISIDDIKNYIYEITNRDLNKMSVFELDKNLLTKKETTFNSEIKSVGLL